MESFNLDIIPRGTMPACHSSQFDVNRKIRVYLLDNGQEFTLAGTETVTLSVRKPDNRVVTDTLTIGANNYVDFYTSEQMTAVVGQSICEIRIDDGEANIGTLNFVLEVEKDPLSSGIHSESVITDLQEQVDEAVAVSLNNYYTKSEVYTKEETDEKVSGLIDDESTDDDKTWSAEKIDGIKTVVDSVTAIHSEEIRTAITPFTLTAGYISANGTVSASTSYKYSQKIAVNEGDKIFVYNPHDNYIGSYRFVCCYYNGSAVESKGGQNLAVPFVVPSGINEVVVSIANNQNPTRAELGTTQSKKELVNQPDVNALVKITANAKANSIFYGFDYTAGNTFETVEYYEDLCSYKVSFFAKISSITGIAKVGKGIGKQYGGGIGFDDTNLYMYQNTSSTPTQTQAHGLTLKDYVSITLDSDYTAQLKVTITTNGGTYTWTISPWFANKGSLSFTANDNMSECKLSYTCAGLTKDTWLYGDSYFSNYDGKRWTYYLVSRGYRNYLLNAYGGRTSRDALGSFKLDLKMNRVPRRVIWCMGMNDKDRESAANASWQACVEEVMSICSNLNIELILATIPNVPSTDAKNDYKNAYVVASGYRYIDFAKAVSLNGDSTWYDDMLASDNVHPKEQGALALYSQAVATVPELLL